MKVPNSTMTELSPKAIKIEQAFHLVCEVGKEVANDVHDQALAIRDQAEERAHSVIEDVKARIDTQKKIASSILQKNANAVFTGFRKTIFRGCSSVIRVVPPFGSSRYDQQRDVCNMNVGVTLALVLTVIVITIYAYRFLKWFISKIRLATAARFTAAHPATDDDDDDDNDSFFDRLNNSDDEEVTAMMRKLLAMTRKPLAMAIPRKLLAVAMLELAMGSLKHKKMREPQPPQKSLAPQLSDLRRMKLQVTMATLLPKFM